VRAAARSAAAQTRDRPAVGRAFLRAIPYLRSSIHMLQRIREDSYVTAARAARLP